MAERLTWRAQDFKNWTTHQGTLVGKPAGLWRESKSNEAIKERDFEIEAFGLLAT